MGIAMLPALFNNKFDAAMKITRKAVLRGAQYSLSHPVTQNIGFELSRGIEDGRIDSAVAPKIMRGFLEAWAHEAAVLGEGGKQAEKDRDQALAEVAASKAGVRIVGAKSFIVNNERPITHHWPPEDK